MMIRGRVNVPKLIQTTIRAGSPTTIRWHKGYLVRIDTGEVVESRPMFRRPDMKKKKPLSPQRTLVQAGVMWFVTMVLAAELSIWCGGLPLWTKAVIGVPTTLFFCVAARALWPGVVRLWTKGEFFDEA